MSPLLSSLPTAGESPKESREERRVKVVRTVTMYTRGSQNPQMDVAPTIIVCNVESRPITSAKLANETFLVCFGMVPFIQGVSSMHQVANGVVLAIPSFTSHRCHRSQSNITLSSSLDIVSLSTSSSPQ